MRLLLAICFLTACASLAAQPSYIVSANNIPGGFTPVAGGTLVPLARGQFSASISPPGFSFHYFGTMYSHFYITSAGYIKLGGIITTVRPEPMPTIDGGVFIAPLWVDLDPGASLAGLTQPTLPPPGEIRWEFSGGVLEVEWKNIPRFNGTPSNSVGVNMKIVLDTAARTIEFHYGPTPTGTTGTVQRIANTCCIAAEAGMVTQEIVPGADGTNIQTGGMVWSYPTNRYVRFEPTFPPPNLPPEIEVVYTDPSQPQPVQVQNNGNVVVAYNTSVAALAFEIDVDDPDADDCTLTAVITNIGSTGIVISQWEATRRPTPFQMLPTSGVFDALTGAQHQVTLTANDGTVDTVFTFMITQQPAPPEVHVQAAGAIVSSGQPAAGTNRDFGSQDIADGPTAALLIEISNLGGLDLVLGNLSFSGDSADFVVDIAAFTNTVPVAGSTSFTVAFDPVTAGGKQVLISFTHNDPSLAGPFEIPVIGTATERLPELVVREAGPGGPIVAHGAGVNFGTLDLRQSSEMTRTFHVRNEGNADLTLSAFAISGTGFDSAPTGIPGVLAPQQGVTLSVSFAPGEEGTFNATLTLEHDDQGKASPFEFSVQGTATRSQATGGAGNGGTGGCTAGAGAIWVLSALLAAALRRRRRRLTD